MVFPSAIITANPCTVYTESVKEKRSTTPSEEKVSDLQSNVPQLRRTAKMQSKVAILTPEMKEAAKKRQEFFDALMAADV